MEEIIQNHSDCSMIQIKHVFELNPVEFSLDLNEENAIDLF